MKLRDKENLLQIIEWPEFLEAGLPHGSRNTAMTIGVFDGVHLGHRALIQRIVNFGRQAVPVVLTFRVNHKKGGGDLLSFSRKMSLLEELGVSICIAADLTASLRHTPGAEFIKILAERGKMGFLAIGDNFRCGYKLDTGAAEIKKLNDQNGIPTGIVEAVAEGGRPVSSSRIRAAISGGKLGEAAAMLGRPHIIELGSGSVADRQGLLYRRSGMSCVFPPPGNYGVLLQKKEGGEKLPSEMQIEKETIRIRATECFDTAVFV